MIFFIFFPLLVHILEIIGLVLLWYRIAISTWLILAVILFLLYAAEKTYRTTLGDGSDKQVQRFWYIARSLVFIVEVLIVVAIYGFIFFA